MRRQEVDPHLLLHRIGMAEHEPEKGGSKQPNWAHGCVEGKSTEGAILVNLSAAWRLQQARRDHIMTYYDASNAFGSFVWPALLEGMTKLAGEGEADYHNEQLAQQAFDLTAAGETQTFRPGVGVLMGRSGGPASFVQTYNEELKAWKHTNNLANTAGTALLAKCPVTGRMADLSLTVYVDDIGKAHAAETTRPELVREAEDRLGQQMAKKGVTMNPGKTEYVIACYGRGAARRRAKLLRHFPTAQREARYLGPVFGRAGRISTEVGRRLAAARVAWSSVGRVWFEPVGWRFLRMLYLSLIQGTFLAGLSAWAVLPPTDLDRLEKAQSRRLRNMMKGKATQRNDRGEVEHSLTNREVLRHWRVLPLSLELRVRRLRRAQRWAAEPTNFVQ